MEFRSPAPQKGLGKDPEIPRISAFCGRDGVGMCLIPLDTIVRLQSHTQWAGGNGTHRCYFSQQLPLEPGPSLMALLGHLGPAAACRACPLCRLPQLYVDGETHSRVGLTWFKVD